MSVEELVLEILEPALDFVQVCPVDSRVIDNTAPTLACPVCGKTFCMFPCAATFASKNKKCPACKKFEMNKLAEIIRNAMHLARLEELNAAGRVSVSVYDKLKLEYEARKKDATDLVYGVRVVDGKS